MKDKTEKMDKEKMEKWADKFKKMGISEDMVDEHLMWRYKKSFIKLMKLRLALSEKGMSEAKIKEVVDKMVDMVMEKDLAKIKEWRSDTKKK